GAPNDSTFGAESGAAYVFTRGGGAWMQEAKIKAGDGASGANFGQSVSISGTTAVIGAAGGSTDAAYVFVRGSGAWSQQQKLTLGGDSTSDFGAAVTVAGNTAVIGAPLHDSFTGGFKADVGGAYVWIRSGSFWTAGA